MGDAVVTTESKDQRPRGGIPAERRGETEAAPDQAWRNLANLILKATSEHIVAVEPTEAEEFRERIQEAAETLCGSPTPAQVLITAGAVSQAISLHNQLTQQKLEHLKGALQQVVDALVAHIAGLQQDGDAAGPLEALRQALRGHLEESSHEKLGEQLSNLLAPLEQAAQKARGEAQQLQEKLLNQITVLEQNPASETISRTARDPGAPVVTDACTGLPVGAKAKVAIERALKCDKQMYLAVFYLHRMGLTNARFGESIGDQVILFCSQHISATITKPRDQLLRWSGPAFVALLERSESFLAVSGEVQRALSTPLSRFFETATRSVYLPIKLTGEVYPMENATYAEVENHIQNYVLKASGVETEAM